MAISEERRQLIAQMAEGSIYDELSEAEFDALPPDAIEARVNEFVDTVPCAEELHLFADLFNWDEGLDTMWRVIRHPLCDRGTALLIYWRAQPGYYLRYGSRDDIDNEEEQEAYDLLREIEQRFETGQYRTATMPFDPRNDHGDDVTPKRSTIQRYGRDIPPVMYQAVQRPE